MSRKIQFVAGAAALASVMGFPVTSTNNKISSLPHTVLFSAHKSRTRSAYSGTKVEDNGPQPGMPPQQQAFQQPPGAPFPGPYGYQRTDPYLQQYQQLQQPQQSQYQQAVYNGDYRNYQNVPASTTVAAQAASMPAQPVPADPLIPNVEAENVSELPQKVGTTSYTANSKPWFEDPRGGFKSVSYQDPVVTPATIDLTPIGQEYNPFVQAMAATAPPMDTGTRANSNVQQQDFPLPVQDFPLPVEMAPPLATIPPPVPEILPPPPIMEPEPLVRKSDGLLTAEPTKAFIQGNSRRTWTSSDALAQSSAVWLQAERPGGPLYVNVKFRNGPSSTPQSMKVYSEDGYLRPLQAYFGRPRGRNRATTQTIDVMNTASMEFPVSATISESRDFGTHGHSFQGDMKWEKIQGKNGIRTYAQDDKTEFVRVNLETDGLPLMANIEVLQGPGDVRQVIELRSDDGSPWEGIVAVPGNGASVIVRNVGPLEFPIRCSVENHGWD
jgi:hypothetical protein